MVRNCDIGIDIIDRKLRIIKSLSLNGLCKDDEKMADVRRKHHQQLRSRKRKRKAASFNKKPKIFPLNGGTAENHFAKYAVKYGVSEIRDNYNNNHMFRVFFSWEISGYLSSFLTFGEICKVRKCGRIFSKMYYICFYEFGDFGTLIVFNERDEVIGYRKSINMNMNDEKK